MDFCKIIQTAMHQVLLQKEYDDDEDMNSMSMTADFDGVRVSIKIGFDSEQKRDDVFDNYDEISAGKFIENAQNSFNPQPLPNE